MSMGIVLIKYASLESLHATALQWCPRRHGYWVEDEWQPRKIWVGSELQSYFSHILFHTGHTMQWADCYTARAAPAAHADTSYT